MKQRKIKHPRAFIAAYGKGPNGTRALTRRPVEKGVFHKRVDGGTHFVDPRPDDIVRGHNTMAHAMLEAAYA